MNRKQRDQNRANSMMLAYITSAPEVEDYGDRYMTLQETARRDGDRVVIGRLIKTFSLDGEELAVEHEELASVYLQ